MAHHPLAKFRFCPLCGSDRFVENNFKSKRCEDCGFVYYFNPSSSTVAIIVNEKNELLVVRRAKEPAKGTLDLSGGFSDFDETSEEGVAREVLEETGLQVVDTQFLFSLPNRYVYSNLEIPTMDMFFRCEVAETAGAHAMDDAAELLWIPLDKVNPDDFGLISIRKGVKMMIKSGILKS